VIVVPPISGREVVASSGVAPLGSYSRIEVVNLSTSPSYSRMVVVVSGSGFKGGRFDSKGL